MEHKTFNAVNYKAKGDGDRVRTGIAAVFGNVDSGGDITHLGAFTKTLSEGRQRIQHLWNHDKDRIPPAKIIEIREVGKADLPAEILQYAPDATGGLLVKREYAKDDAFAMDLLRAIDDGRVREMSYAYNPIKSDFSKVDGEQIRNLREVALFDTSDVNYGMNPATVATGAKGFHDWDMPLGLLWQHLNRHIANFEKAGRRNNHIDQTIIDALHDSAVHLGCRNCAAKEESPKHEEPPPIPERAEAAIKSTSLELLKLKAQELALRAAITRTTYTETYTP